MILKFNVFALIMSGLTIGVIESRVLPGMEYMLPPVVDVFNPLAFTQRERSAYTSPYRTMLLTELYRRPFRRSGDQASSVYAEGSSVIGGTYFGQPQYTDFEDEVATSDAEAPLESDEKNEQKEDNRKPQVLIEEDEEFVQSHHPSRKPSKNHPKKSKKVTPAPAPVDEDEEEEYDEEDEDLAIAPIPPSRSNKNGHKTKHFPNLNNFFPMVFSFPSSGVGSRGSLSDSSGGTPITAVANSYSTGRSGVASSVATAYGGLTTKKQRPVSTSSQT